MFNDKSLKCKDCGKEFVFSASEQEFYVKKGFKNEPQRCPDCRAARKQQAGNKKGGFGKSNRKMYKAICAECGRETTVPFEPNGSKPVYCKDCFQRGR